MAPPKPGTQTRLSFLDAPVTQTEAQADSPPDAMAPEARPDLAMQARASQRLPRSSEGAPTEVGDRRVWSVTQIVQGLNKLLDVRFANLWIEGEIVGLKLGRSGHAYFTLKDDASQIPVAMWRAAVDRLRFRLEEGLSIRAYGRISVFAKQGRLQFYVERVEPVGLGALMLELEQRKAKLAAEGLFDAARKRPLPTLPRRVGVVTSLQAAALQDVLKVARRRCPMTMLISPAAVQGQDAPGSIVAALRRLYARSDLDVIIVTRGGGAAEDLWSFNDEAVVRAIAESPVPVVSGVGHEIDTTLADLVADVRAATPSQAAEIVVPDREELRARIARARDTAGRLIERRVLEARQRLEGGHHRLASQARHRLAAHHRTLGELQRRLDACHPQRRVAEDRRRLSELKTTLERLGRGLGRVERTRLQRDAQRLDRQASRMTNEAQRRLADGTSRLERAGRKAPAAFRLRLTRASATLDALSPLAVLSRGFAVVSREDGRALLQASDVASRETLHVRLHQGRMTVSVLEVHEGEVERDDGDASDEGIS